MTRCTNAALIAGLISAFGCSSDDLPPPPADAVTSCVYTVPTRDTFNRSTLWYDANDRVIRIDGYDDQTSPAPYYFEYDSDGRITSQTRPDREHRYVYSPEEIEETIEESGSVATLIWQLVDGRAVHFAGPIEMPVERQVTRDYEYDEAGRVTKGAVSKEGITYSYEYTYDAQGRLATFVKNRNNWTDPISMITVAYSETGDQLTVVTTESRCVSGCTSSWTFTFDAYRRVTRVELFDPDGALIETAIYTYGSDVIHEEVQSASYHQEFVATGRCDPPQLWLNPPAPLPIPLYANYVTLQDIMLPLLPWQ